MKFCPNQTRLSKTAAPAVLTQSTGFGLVSTA